MRHENKGDADGGECFLESGSDVDDDALEKLPPPPPEMDAVGVFQNPTATFFICSTLWECCTLSQRVCIFDVSSNPVRSPPL